MLAIRTLLATLLVCLLVSPVAGSDWPQWRGPSRDGVWPQKGKLGKLEADLKPRWRVPIGGGYSGVAVVGGRVYTMDRQTRPKEVERVLCFEAATGKILWSHAYEVAYGKMEYGNGPRCTPTIHQGKVYTFGARGHLFCLEAKSGKVLWSHDTVKDFQARVPTWGHACSPLIYEHEGKYRLLVQVGAPGACMMAFDPDRGSVIWKSLDDPPGYASPVLIAGKNFRQIAYWTPEHVVGLDAATGKLRWKVPFKITYGVSISDIIYHDGVLLASDYWYGSKALVLDDNGENPKIIWEGKRLRLLMSTPLKEDGYIYALDRTDGLKCVHLKTGEIRWEGQHITPRARNPQAALVKVGDRLLAFNAAGELVLAQVSPRKYEEISRVKVLDRLVWAHPAFADGAVFIRDDEELLCVPLRFE